jgi:transcription elongation factor S-II
MEEFKQLKARLEKSTAEQNPNETFKVLDLLSEKKVTLEILKITQIGVSVGKLRKHEDKRIVAAAKKLVDEWKSALPASNGGSPSTPIKTEKEPTSPNGSNPDVVVKKEQQVKKEVVSAEKEENGDKKRKAESDNKTPIKKKPIAPSPKTSSPANGDAALRDKVKVLLVESLGPKQSDDELDPMEVAEQIEEELFKLFNGVTKDYKHKFRSLSFNLKNEKNPQLRRDILSGAITVDRFCRMSAQEMASPEEQAKRKEIEKYHLEAAKIGQMEASTDMFLCNKCKNRKCMYYQLQTRSADEPMTTFVTCTVCNNRWKFC